MNGGLRSREEGFIEEAVWECLMQVEVWPQVEVACACVARCSFMQRYGRSARGLVLIRALGARHR